MQGKQELLEEIEDLSNNADQENFVKATAIEILSYPYAKHLGFWYTLSLQEREIIYEKVIERIEIQEGKVVSVTLKVWDKYDNFLTPGSSSFQFLFLLIVSIYLILEDNYEFTINY